MAPEVADLHLSIRSSGAPSLHIAEFPAFNSRDEIHPLGRAKTEDGAANFLRVPHQVRIGRDGCFHTAVGGAPCALSPTKLRVSLIHFAVPSLPFSFPDSCPG